MRFYQVDVHFLPEVNPNAEAYLEQLGMKLAEERPGLVRGWMPARSESHALEIARDALSRIEDGDVLIIKPSPEPRSSHPYPPASSYSPHESRRIPPRQPVRWRPR